MQSLEDWYKQACPWVLLALHSLLHSWLDFAVSPVSRLLISVVSRVHSCR